MNIFFKNKSFFVFLIIGVLFPIGKSTSLIEFNIEKSYLFEIELQGKII